MRKLVLVAMTLLCVTALHAQQTSQEILEGYTYNETVGGYQLKAAPKQEAKQTRSQNIRIRS
jgi:hypothetical protein